LRNVWIQKYQIIGSEIAQTEDFFGRLAGAGMALWFYLGKALFPLQLSMIYPRWKIDASLPASYLALLFWCVALVVCWRFRHGRGRPVLFALVCFTVTLFPVLGFFDIYFMVFSRVSDHFQYLPLICIVALVVAALAGARSEKVLRWVAAISLVGLGALTYQRAQVFSTEERLWVDTLQKNPAAWNAHNNLGLILLEKGELNEAVRHFEASLTFNPRNTPAHVNLGKARMAEKNFTAAEVHFRAALESEAIRFWPEVLARQELAGVYRATGRTREAIEECRRALGLKPDHADTLSNLAWLLATTADDTLRDGQEAVRCAKRACELTGYKHPQMIGVLAAAYAEAGQFDKATTTAQQAIELARVAGNFQFAVANEQLLRLYTSGQPYHEPPSKPANQQ
jgi:tetratricopeptide (TPR) repeat protein